jgi:hypothetical protein
VSETFLTDRCMAPEKESLQTISHVREEIRANSGRRSEGWTLTILTVGVRRHQFSNDARTVGDEAMKRDEVVLSVQCLPRLSSRPRRP